MANHLKVLKAERRREAARKAAVTRLKNKLAKTEAKLWALEEKCEEFLLNGCPACGESVDVRDIEVEDE